MAHIKPWRRSLKAIATDWSLETILTDASSSRKFYVDDGVVGVLGFRLEMCGNE